MPTSIDSQIQSRIEAFVQELSDLVREAAIESVHDALGASSTTRRSTTRKKRTSKKKAVRSARSTSRKTGSRKKRSSSQVDDDAARILAHVKANPGQGAEHVSKALRLTTKDIQLPVRKLIADKKLRTEGQRRGTKYFAGAGGGGKKKAAKKKARRKIAKKAARKKRATSK